MDVVALIQKKRAGGSFTAREMTNLVQGLMLGEVPDYQLAAWLMAVCYEHLSFEETLALTQALLESGNSLTWNGMSGPVVDKHSTGGVGDKVSLVLIPWLAAAGLIVPKMSGRGLGHTGGTVDKLESIPGLRLQLQQEELARQLRQIGCAVIAQSQDLVPADKRIYAIRDATDTVAELGLIAASVMSKKIAGGAAHIVLDIKCGAGAFFASQVEAAQFGELACRIGSSFGRRVGYIISAMEQPLGRSIGNALEVREAMAVLADSQAAPDVYAVCLELGAVLLLSTGLVQALPEGRTRMEQLHAEKQAARRFEQWIAAQSGDLAAFQHKLADLERYRRIEVLSGTNGYVAQVSSRGLGELARSLGAGRLRSEDSIDYLVGLEGLAKVGDLVQPGDVLAVIWAKPDEAARDSDLRDRAIAYFTISPSCPAPQTLILDVTPRLVV